MNIVFKDIKRFLRRQKINAICMIAKIKLHPYPCFIIYNPPVPKFQHLFDIVDNVLPGDILLRANERVLSSLSIPGCWKHAGMVTNSRTVIHAVSAGVHEEDLLEWCKTDNICVLRIPGLDADQIKHIIEHVTSQINAHYDFAFRLDNKDFYCSELIAYGIADFIKLDPKTHKVWKLYNAWPMITPEDLYDHPGFTHIYENSAKTRKVQCQAVAKE